MATSPTLAILHRSCATPTNRASQSGCSLRGSYSHPKRWSRSRSREEARSQGSQKPEWLTQIFWLLASLASGFFFAKVESFAQDRSTEQRILHPTGKLLRSTSHSASRPILPVTRDAVLSFSGHDSLCTYSEGPVSPRHQVMARGSPPDIQRCSERHRP